MARLIEVNQMIWNLLNQVSKCTNYENDGITRRREQKQSSNHVQRSIRCIKHICHELM